MSVFCCVVLRLRTPGSTRTDTLFPDTPLFRSCGACLADPPPFEGAPAAVAYGPAARTVALRLKYGRRLGHARLMAALMLRPLRALAGEGDRKSTRLNSSH